MGKLVAGVALAAISAVTIVAYKHPKAYIKLWVALTISLSAGIVGIGVWDISNIAASNTLLNIDLPSNKLTEAMTTIKSAMPPAWWVWILIAINGYLVVLATLPQWLLDPEKPKNQND